MPNLIQKAAGYIGGRITNSNDLGTIAARELFRSVAPKFTLASSLQNWGGQSGSNMPFRLVPQVMASDGGGSARQDTGGTAQNPYQFPETIEIDRTNNNTGGNTGGNIGTNIDTNGTNLINQGLQSGNDSIERDYQDALMQADTAEQGLRAQAGQATSELNLQGTQTKNALEAQRQTAEAGVAGQEQTAQSQAKTATQQARDLFRQTQQQNIAQLSALGLSSSSVMEGLAEKLGVETARRIGAVSASVNDIMQNLSKERARVNDYAKAKTAEVEQQIGLQIQSIQSQLLQGIKQISDSRQLAATAKANARAELLSQAQNQIYNIQSNAQQFAQQMQAWAAQKNAAISEASKSFQVTPTDFSALSAAQQNIQGITGVGGQLSGYKPSYTILPTGKFTTTLKPSNDDDELANPFAVQ